MKKRDSFHSGSNVCAYTRTKQHKNKNIIEIICFNKKTEKREYCATATTQDENPAHTNTHTNIFRMNPK